ncbi:hypothetical protein ACX0G7_16815 [Flavitalea antarctica]
MMEMLGMIIFLSAILEHLLVLRKKEEVEIRRALVTTKTSGQVVSHTSQKKQSA